MENRVTEAVHDWCGRLVGTIGIARRIHVSGMIGGGQNAVDQGEEDAVIAYGQNRGAQHRVW